MSDAFKDVGAKLDRIILMEGLRELQTNPVADLGDPPDDPKERREWHRVYSERMRSYNNRNRAGAYIFGDTYEGMPLEDALKIIMDEGFAPTGQMPGMMPRFQHQYLGIGLTIRCTAETEDQPATMTHIVLDLALSINPDIMKTADFCGLGMIEPEVKGKYLYGQVEATGGFRTKLLALRFMASAGPPGQIALNPIHPQGPEAL